MSGEIEMECLAIIFFLCILGGLFQVILELSDLATADKRRKISDHESKIKSLEIEIKNRETFVRNNLKQIFFENVEYNSMKASLKDAIKMMKFRIDDIEYENKCLNDLDHRKDYTNVFSPYRDYIYPELKEMVEKFVDFTTKIKIFSLLMGENTYGIIDEEHLALIKTIEKKSAVEIIEKYRSLILKDNISQNDLDTIYQINLVEILSYIWFFATEKVYSATDFTHAKELFSKVYKKEHIEVIVAELYAKKKVGGEDALRDSIKELLKSNRDTETLTKIASGLMWMKAYQAEAMVLKHMLENGMEMSQKAQERLQVLSNGSGKAPDGFDVKSENDNLYFDVSSLTWREEEYKGFFDNLSFRDSNLTYSLTIRDEDKELFISQGIQIPADSDILKKLREVFEEEYGSSVVSRQVEATALSGSGEERLKGILIYSEECSQMGIFVHLVKIGKKVDIKFYTLLIPENVSAEEQLQKALSLQKKLSPTVNMWEGSLKETTLMGIQQLLNKESQSTSKETENDSFHKNVNSDEPVF